MRPGVEQGEEFLGLGYRLGGPVDFQPFVTGDKTHAENLLDAGKVFFAAAKQLAEVAGVGVMKRLGFRHFDQEK